MGSARIIGTYIQQLIEHSTPEAPAWNIEKIRAGKPNTWNYIDGCMIKALLDLHDISGKDAYLDFADRFIDHFVRDDGSIDSYDPKDYNLDNVNAGKTLCQLYAITGKPKYRKAMDTIYSQLERQPRTSEGNFWHKLIYPNQVWLDGLYMAQPFYLQYELNFREGRGCSDSLRQFATVYDRMRNERNGLYYHAYDASREAFWCDPVTGLSDGFWLRAEGWYAMALLDAWEILPASMGAGREQLRRALAELIDAMLPYQDRQTGMWHQVINVPNIEPNYPETSGSAIFAYVLMKATRLGVLPERYWRYGFAAYRGICDGQLGEDDGALSLGGICLVAGLGGKDRREGTFDYYMREPVVRNDAKGVAPLILAFTEVLRRDRGASASE